MHLRGLGPLVSIGRDRSLWPSEFGSVVVDAEVLTPSEDVGGWTMRKEK